MLVKAMVFGGQDRVNEGGRNLRQADQPALLPGALVNAADGFGLQLKGIDRLVRHARPASSVISRTAFRRMSTNSTVELVVGVGKGVQKMTSLPLRKSIAVFAAVGDLRRTRPRAGN